MFTHRNKWRYRGGFNPSRKIGQSLPIPPNYPGLSTGDEMETETEDQNLSNVCDSNGPSDFEFGTLTRKRNVRRYSVPSKLKDYPSSPSISSDSEVK